MKLLLQACCADCLLRFVDSINKNNKEITEIVVYFYNPNIHPRSEYLARLRTIQKISEENGIKLIVADWIPKEWFEIQNPSVLRTAPLDEGEPQKNKTRCEGCWEMRLRRTFEYAKQKGFEMISSTLITSHYQDSEKIKKIAKKLENEYKIKFLVPQKISKDLKTKGFYKQNYCGCCFSLVEGWMEKFEN